MTLKTYTITGQYEVGLTLCEGCSKPFNNKFNSKEYQDELSLNVTAMDFRQYDNAIGRFNCIDLLAERNAYQSTYQFGNNNPIFFSDPSGLDCTVLLQALWDLTIKESTWYNDGDGGFVTLDEVHGGASGGSVNASGEFTGATSLPEMVLVVPRHSSVSSISGNWSSLIQQHVYNNSPYYNNGSNSGFDNSSTALDIGGGIYGGLQGLTTSQGYWLGNNGKYYNTSWGGNQYTGSRAGALKAANNYKLAGRALVVGSVLIGIYETRVGYQMDGGQFGYNAQMAAASSAGSIVGGIAGAEAGALIGASIGACFGGVGAIPGAIIGGVIGGFGLGMAGGYYGGQLGSSAVNYYHGR